MMREPKKPTKKITVRNSQQLPFEFVSKKWSLDGFISQCKKLVPRNAKDATLELMEEWMYDDCYAYLELSWNEVVDNPHYDRQMKKYQVKMRKWKKQNETPQRA